MQRAVLEVADSRPAIIDGAAKVISDLLAMILAGNKPWQIPIGTDAAIAWLKAHDHPTLWLRDSVRQEMDRQ